MEGFGPVGSPASLGGGPPNPMQPDRRGPGRPAVSAEQRALSDERYRQLSEVMEALPKNAKEMRFKVFECHDRRDVKLSVNPVEIILQSDWIENGFNDMSTLSAWLSERIGDGRYIIETYDAHNARVARVPAFTVDAGDIDPMDDRRGFRRRRSRYDDDDYDDDYDDDLDDPVRRRESRANLADRIEATARQNAAAEAQRRNDAQAFNTQLVVSQQQMEQMRREDERLRREDDRKREEAAREDRRREDDRRRDEERKAEDRRREDDRRRDEERRADERREDERRREEDRRRDAERREEFESRMAAENRKMEMMLAAIPLLDKIFKPDNSRTDALMALVSKKESDPVLMMVLKSMMDKAEKTDFSTMFLQQFQTMLQAGQQLNQQQLTSMLEFSSNMNQKVMERALKMMLDSPQGQTAEGKSTIEKIIGAVQGAADIVRTLVPGAQQPQPQPRGFVRGPQPAAPPVAPAPAIAQGTPGQTGVAQAQPAEEEMAVPEGVDGVLSCLMAICHQQHGQVQMTHVEFQATMQAMLQEMPPELALAILEGNQQEVFAICGPSLQRHEVLSQWIRQPGVLGWVQQFVPALAPHIEQFHGNAEHLRNFLATEQGAAPAAPPAVPTTAAPAVVPAAAQTSEAPAATEEAAMEPPVETEAPAASLPGPGSINNDSHLSGDDV